MSNFDELKRAMHPEQPESRREKRAARTRARALSPARIVMSLLSLPLVAGGVAVSIYIRTSDYDPPQALAHLVARAGCDASLYVGLAPAYRGGLGYHARNDADGDGVACEVSVQYDMAPAQSTEIAAPAPVRETPDRKVSGAKFVKP